MKNITSWSCLLFVFVTTSVKGESEKTTKKAEEKHAPSEHDGNDSTVVSNNNLTPVNATNEATARYRTHQTQTHKRGLGGAYGSLNAGYNNGYSLGSGYSTGLLLPTGSGIGTRYASGLGYQTSGYGPALGIGSGLGIASGLNSINSMGSAPVGLSPTTVYTSAPGGNLYSPPIAYSSSGFHSSASPSYYPYGKSYETKPLIITKEVPVHIPQPYPVTITKDVPYPVHVHVPQPVAVPVDKPYPVKVDRPVYYPYPQPVPYPVEKHVPYPVVKTVVMPVYDTHSTYGKGSYSPYGHTQGAYGK